MFRCTTCWIVNEGKTKETQQQKEKLIAQLKGRTDELERETEKAATRFEKQQKESHKQDEKLQKQTEEVAKRKNELNALKEEKEKMKEINTERARKIKEQEALIGKLNREKADLTKESEKTSNKIKELEEANQKILIENEQSKIKLIKEIENRETEIAILNRTNQELKKEIRITKIDITTMVAQDELPIVTEESGDGEKTMVETGIQCYLERNSAEINDATTTQQDSPGSVDNDVNQLQQEVAVCKKSIAEKVNVIAKKNKEIESLKVRIAEYRNRLENTLGENSAREKEMHHLTDALETLKRTNVQLVMELEGKGEGDVDLKKADLENDGNYEDGLDETLNKGTNNVKDGAEEKDSLNQSGNKLEGF